MYTWVMQKKLSKIDAEKNLKLEYDDAIQLFTYLSSRRVHVF